MDQLLPKARLLKVQEVGVNTDTRDLLKASKADMVRRGYADWLVVDIDAHHVESVYWHEIVKYIEDPVIRTQAEFYHKDRVGAPPYGLNGDLGLRYQDVGGRIPHQSDRRESVANKSVHKDVVLTRRAMDAFCADWMVVFPTPMLFLGMHPQPEMEVQLCNAYNAWLVDNLIGHEDGITALASLPFNTPEAAEKTVAKYANDPRIIGFTVTSTRYKPVHANEYMRLYRMIEESGKPLAFHAGYHWQDPSLATVPTFLGMHSLGFAWCNIVHMTNWVLCGIPEKFPKLKSLWVESGLAWVPFLMQRLDDQYLMRPSEAPLLKRLPSEYMRTNCWYTSQPIERTSVKGLRCTLEMINAETQLLYASDWPHFDFDAPNTIFELPGLSEQARRNIMGLNAARIFNLPETKKRRFTAEMMD